MNYKFDSDKALLSSLVISNPEMSLRQILQIFGLKKVFEFANVRELKDMFSNFNTRSWNRLINDANKVSKLF